MTESRILSSNPMWKALLLVATSAVLPNKRVVTAYMASPLRSTLSRHDRIQLHDDSREATVVGTFHTQPQRLSRRSVRRWDAKDVDSTDAEKPQEASPFDSKTGTFNATEANFGDVMPLKRSTSAEFGDVMPLKRSTSAEFGDVVSMEKPSTTSISDVELLRQRKKRNIGVAILSVFLAVANYAWQWTHPVTPIQLLVNMERSSTPLTEIGKNNKPTVIDFWAPWCENCRYMAPTLFQIEESYKDKVNFVMVNGDDAENWPLIEALGVDAIPHLAMVESDGTVDTALIGIVPKEWLVKDIDTLLENAKKGTVPMENPEASKRPLPYQMLDVFANRQPESRVISNLDDRR